MSILTRYILRRFFLLALFTMSATLMVFITVDLMEHLDKFIDTQTPRSEILRYYLLYMPQILYLIAPVILLLTTVFTLGGLVRTMEVTAMKASGISPGRLLRLLAFWGLVFSVGIFYLGESVVTDTAQERMEIYRTRIKKKPPTLRQNSGRIYYQNGPTSMLTLENYNIEKGEGTHPVYLEFDHGKLTRRVDARKLRRDGPRWRMEKGTERLFNGGGHVESFANRPMHEITLKLRDIETLSAVPEEMNYKELQAFILRQKNSGARTSRWEVNALSKIAAPLANFVIVLFGVPLALRRQRGGMVMGFGISLLCCFLFYGIQVLCQNLGYKEILTPALAAWAPALLFATLAGLLYWRLDR
jgi:lipopolysaccharide export system permease protein